MTKKWLTTTLLLSTLLLASSCSKEEPKSVAQSSTSSTTLVKEAHSTTIETSISDTTESSETTVNSSTEPFISESEEVRKLPDQLLPYTDDEIEYARVWLSVMGANYLDHLDNDFELNIFTTHQGEPISPYGEGSIDWPFDTITLTGNFSYQGQIVYTSNHDGSINVYDVPSHWHQPAEQLNDPVYMENFTQDIVNHPRVVNVEVGNPDVVEALIRMEVKR